jgi:RNA 2',3'-cyclic 3'-phosphodiesterase
MRLFLAIELPQPVRQYIGDLCGGLRSFPLSIVPPQNLHVTLKFLGDVPESEVPALSESLREAARGEASQVWADRAELLPPRGPIRVVAVGLGGEVSKLRRMHKSIEKGCGRQGFPPERRKYLPHITLARARQPHRGNERDDLSRAASKGLPSPPFDVEGVTLFESKLGPGPPQYIPLERLGG